MDGASTADPQWLTKSDEELAVANLARGCAHYETKNKSSQNLWQASFVWKRTRWTPQFVHTHATTQELLVDVLDWVKATAPSPGRRLCPRVRRTRSPLNPAHRQHSYEKIWNHRQPDQVTTIPLTRSLKLPVHAMKTLVQYLRTKIQSALQSVVVC